MYLDNRILKVHMLAKLLVETLFFSSEKVLKLQFLHLWSKPGDVFLQWSYNPYKEGYIVIYCIYHYITNYNGILRALWLLTPFLSGRGSSSIWLAVDFQPI